MTEYTVTQLSVPNAIDVAFLERMAQVRPLSWGGPYPGDPGMSIIMFDSSKATAIVDALAAYPQAKLEAVKMERLEALAEIRAERELSGPQGLILTEKTLNRINGAVVLLNNNPLRQHIKFEAQRGHFLTIPRSMMIDIGVAVGEYIQACFEHVSDITDIIKSVELPSNDLQGLTAALAELHAVDLEFGWPVA